MRRPTLFINLNDEAEDNEIQINSCYGYIHLIAKNI